MQATSPTDLRTSSQAAPRTGNPASRLGPADLLVLAAWCGLAGGLLEVGMRVLCRTINPVHRLYLMSRHFFWLTPLVNLMLLCGLGLGLAALTRVFPRIGGKIGSRIICTFAVLPMLMMISPQIFPEAWLILALGVASWLAHWIEQRPLIVRRRLIQTFPVLLAIDVILAGTVFGGDWLKQKREAARPFPPAGSPSVLFIVLDTVRADRMSLHGYRRPTTPRLEQLARRGIRFDAARATAPWTLPSHASFFTGRWPHELDVQWATPLRGNDTMLAEYMGARGYATAGLVSNMYCSYDTGLDRGFTYFEDYMLEGLAFLRTSAIVEEVVKNTVLLGLHHSSGALNAMQTRLRSIFSYAVRRDARSINQGFLQWLDRRTEPGRPFFVFLNYLDAHTPYKVPSDQSRRFGRKPQTDEEVWVVYDEWTTLDKQYVPRPYLTMARDCYDSCLAYIDKEIGRLCDDLERRGMLETTWIVITSDHGEGLGEHDLYDHGESLFSTETHVPLLIIPPLSTKTKPRKIEQVVSLRDLPATIVDLAGLNDRSQFPGHSLSPLWADSRQGSAVVVSIGFSELANPSPVNASHGRSPAYRGPLVSLADDDLLYIRNERDGAEELYNERNDPGELTNLARDNSMAPAVKRFRDYLARIKR